MSKSLNFGCIALLLAGLMVLAGCPNPADETKSDNFSVAGTITAAGVDLTVADVQLEQNNVLVGNVIHPAANGKFTFSDVAKGKYKVRVTINNFGSALSEEITVPNAPGVAITLSKTKDAVMGTVTVTPSTLDKTKAVLYLVRGGNDVMDIHPNSDGSFEFSNIDSGNGYHIRAEMQFCDTEYSADFNVPGQGAIGISLTRLLPVFSAVSVKNNDNKLYLEFNEEVQIDSAAGFTVNTTGTAITLSSPVKDGTDGLKWTLTMSRIPDLRTEDLTLNYNAASGTVRSPVDGAKPAILNGKEIKKPFMLIRAERRPDFDMMPTVPGMMMSSVVRVYFTDTIKASSVGGNPAEGFTMTSNGSDVTGMGLKAANDPEMNYLNDGTWFDLMVVGPKLPAGSVITVSYASPPGTAESINGDILPAVSDLSVTNP